LSVIIMILFLIVLIILIHKVEIGKKIWTWWDKLLIQVPFSVYLGWISVATIANMSALLVNINWNMFWLSDIFWTIVVIIVAMLLALLSLYKHYNIPFALVIIWAFIGIIIKRVSIDPIYASSIIRTLWICIFIILISIVRRMNKWIKN
jgi:hypothetical protein